MDTFLDAAAVVIVGVLAVCAVWLIWDPSMIPAKAFGTTAVALFVTGILRDSL